jgi:hypothetical protein
VDFRADKDFPSDDSGHGFDNIGDVLTVSPIPIVDPAQREKAVQAMTELASAKPVPRVRRFRRPDAPQQTPPPKPVDPAKPANTL